MRNYLKLKLFHGYYINISIDWSFEPTVRLKGGSGHYRKNKISFEVIGINPQIEKITNGVSLSLPSPLTLTVQRRSRRSHHGN